MNEFQDRVHVSDEFGYIDGRLFALEPDPDLELQNGHALLLTLPPGSSSSTVATLEVQEETGDPTDPYSTTFETVIHGGETAALPIQSPSDELVRARIRVNRRLVSDRRYTLSDDHDGTPSDPHVHELRLMAVGPRRTDEVVGGPQA